MKIDDLNDEMLQEILCRLPCYRTARRCKSVSKRWNSVISDPFFITQGFLTRREIKDEEPSTVFLLNMTTMRLRDYQLVTVIIAPPCLQTMADLKGASKSGPPKILKYLVKILQFFGCSAYTIVRPPVGVNSWQRTLSSPFLSLEFLPYESTVEATFKDLILSYGRNPLTGLPVYYICNPLTKQWMVLPPPQVLEKDYFIWAAFTYEDGRGFRVVAAHSKPETPSITDPLVMINLLIYISETCEWRNIHVRLQLELDNDGDNYPCPSFNGVVCEGMVCFHYKGHFGALNPFDLTDTLMTAIYLPSPAGKVYTLLESHGNLLAYECYITLMFHCQGNLGYFSAGKPIWKLDMRSKQLPPEWEMVLQTGDRIDKKGSMLEVLESSAYGCYDFAVVGVHPSKEHLVYMATAVCRSHHTWLVLLDTKSKTVEQLMTKIISPHYLELLSKSPKIDIPSWPTPIPLVKDRRISFLDSLV